MANHSSILAWRIPIDGEAWWATVCGIAKNWEWGKQHITSTPCVRHWARCRYWRYFSPHLMKFKAEKRNHFFKNKSFVTFFYERYMLFLCIPILGGSLVRISVCKICFISSSFCTILLLATYAVVPHPLHYSEHTVHFSVSELSHHLL